MSSRHITHYAHVINKYIIHHMRLMISRMTTVYVQSFYTCNPITVFPTQSCSYSHAALQYNCQPCLLQMNIFPNLLQPAFKCIISNILYTRTYIIGIIHSKIQFSLTIQQRDFSLENMVKYPRCLCHIKSIFKTYLQQDSYSKLYRNTCMALHATFNFNLQNNCYPYQVIMSDINLNLAGIGTYTNRLVLLEIFQLFISDAKIFVNLCSCSST